MYATKTVPKYAKAVQKQRNILSTKNTTDLLLTLVNTGKHLYQFVIQF